MSVSWLLRFVIEAVFFTRLAIDVRLMSLIAMPVLEYTSIEFQWEINARSIVVVALLFIPVVRGEAGTVTGRRFFSILLRRRSVSLPSLPSPTPRPHSPLPFHSRQISLHSLSSSSPSIIPEICSGAKKICKLGVPQTALQNTSRLHPNPWDNVTENSRVLLNWNGLARRT